MASGKPQAQLLSSRWTTDHQHPCQIKLVAPYFSCGHLGYERVPIGLKPESRSSQSLLLMWLRDFRKLHLERSPRSSVFSLYSTWAPAFLLSTSFLLRNHHHRHTWKIPMKSPSWKHVISGYGRVTLDLCLRNLHALLEKMTRSTPNSAARRFS